MTVQKHNASEFKNSNPGWAARTASRMYRSWQVWQADATNHDDELAQSIANEHKQDYLDFIAKRATDEAARAVADEHATAFIEANRAAVVEAISTVAHWQLRFTYTALNLRKYHRQDTTLRPSEIGRNEALQHTHPDALAAAEAHAASSKNGISKINTMGDIEITIKVVKSITPIDAAFDGRVSPEKCSPQKRVVAVGGIRGVTAYDPAIVDPLGWDNWRDREDIP